MSNPREEKGNWFVNIGHVTDRGRWKTEPHAHPNYGQVIFVRNGRGVMNLEGHSVPFEGPARCCCRTNACTAWTTKIDADRWVVTARCPICIQINSKLREFSKLWAEPRVIPMSYAAESATEFYRLIRKLQQEVDGQDHRPCGRYRGLADLAVADAGARRGIGQVDEQDRRRARSSAWRIASAN
jgi:AraC family transcriptional activator of pobA